MDSLSKKPSLKFIPRDYGIQKNSLSHVSFYYFIININIDIFIIFIITIIIVIIVIIGIINLFVLADKNTKENHKKFFDHFAHEMKFDPLLAENWYQYSHNDFQSRKVYFLFLSFFYILFLFT